MPDTLRCRVGILARGLHVSLDLTEDQLSRMRLGELRICRRTVRSANKSLGWPEAPCNARVTLVCVGVAQYVGPHVLACQRCGAVAWDDTVNPPESRNP